MQIKRWFIRLFFSIYHKFTSVQMVSYWKHGEAQKARIFTAKDGSVQMDILGEKYPFPGYPRGHLLFGSLSPLKHQVKNKIFNDAWYALERAESPQDVIKTMKAAWTSDIVPLIEKARIDMVPPEKLCAPVRELHRALTAIEWKHDVRAFKEYLTFLFQEDDAYRFRFSWLIAYFNPSSLFNFFKKDFRNDLDLAFEMIEHAEVIGDMKERIRLWRRGFMLMLEDPYMKEVFDALCKEVDWNKVALKESDRYFFRAKYFRVDMDRGVEY